MGIPNRVRNFDGWYNVYWDVFREPRDLEIVSRLSASSDWLLSYQSPHRPGTEPSFKFRKSAPNGSGSVIISIGQHLNGTYLFVSTSDDPTVRMTEEQRRDFIGPVLASCANLILFTDPINAENFAPSFVQDVDSKKVSGLTLRLKSASGLPTGSISTYSPKSEMPCVGWFSGTDLMALEKTFKSLLIEAGGILGEEGSVMLLKPAATDGKKTKGKNAEFMTIFADGQLMFGVSGLKAKSGR